MRDVSTLTLYTFKDDIAHVHTTDIDVLNSYLPKGQDVIIKGGKLIIDGQNYLVEEIYVEPSCNSREHSHLNPIYGMLKGNPYPWKTQVVVSISKII